MAHKIAMAKTEHEPENDSRTNCNHVRKANKTYRMGSVLVAVLMLGVSLGYMISADTPTGFPTVIEPGSQVSSSAFVIFTDGVNVYARNGTTGAIDISGTNATIVINTAINSTGLGGIIHLRAGEYVCRSPIFVLRSDVSLVGSGHATILNGTGTTNPLVLLKSSYVRVSDLSLTGNPYAGIAIYQGGCNITISNVFAYGLGIACIAAFMIYPDASGTIQNVTYIDCEVRDSACFGYYNNGNGNHLIKNIWYERCTAVNLGIASRYNDYICGFDLMESGTLQNCFVSSCQAINCWQSGFTTEAGAIKSAVLMESCQSIGNGVKGLGLAGYGYVVTAGMTLSNCLAVSNLDAGFYLANSALGVMSLTGCRDESSATGCKINYVTGQVYIDGLILNLSGGYSLDVTNAANIHARGVVIDHPTGSAAVGMRLASAGGRTTNSEFEFTFVGGSGLTAAIFAQNLENTIISGYIDTSAAWAIGLNNAMNVTVRDMLILAHGTYGIHSYGTTPCKMVKIENTHIEDRSVSPILGTGINANDATHQVIVDRRTVIVLNATTPYSPFVNFTMNWGNQSITGAVNSVSFNHCLIASPTLALVTPVQTGYGNISVIANATQITINFDNQPGGATWYFHWYAQTW